MRNVASAHMWRPVVAPSEGRLQEDCEGLAARQRHRLPEPRRFGGQFRVAWLTPTLHDGPPLPGAADMEINVPFSQFYAAELQATFDRSGRPDETFFARCASVPGINAKYYARTCGNDANTLARIEGARDIEDCAFSHPKIKSHFVRYSSYTAYNFHFMEVHARSHEKLRDHPELIAQAERMVAESVGKSDSVEFAGNRRLKFQLRRGHHRSHGSI